MVMRAAEKRGERRRSEARRAILDAAEALLLEEGSERFSVRRLVLRCGYSAPTIYHHFGDKPGLIDALLEEKFQRLLRQISRVPQGDDAVENLRALARAFVRFGQRNPTSYRLLTAPRSEQTPPPPSAEQARTLMEAPLHELARRGRVDPSRVEVAGQTLWALTHGLISLRSARPDHPWSKELVDVAVDAILRGLFGAESAAPARRAVRA